MHIPSLLVRFTVVGGLLSGLLCSWSGALSEVSHWASEEVAFAEAQGLSPNALADKPATEPITRGEFCAVALRIYQSLTGKTVTPSSSSPFPDTDDPIIAAAHALGIVSGRPDGTFAPNALIKRQDLCIVLQNILTISHITPPTLIGQSVLEQFTDAAQIDSYARLAAASMADYAVVGGTTGASNTILFSPHATATREQALLFASRFCVAFAPLTEPIQNLGSYGVASSESESNAQTGSTPAAPPSSDPEGNAQTGSALATPPSSDPEGNTQAGSAPVESPASDSEGSTSVVLTPSDSTSPAPTTPSISTANVVSDKWTLVYGAQGEQYTTEEQALSNMIQITVPVWRQQFDGSKIAGTASLTVHRNLASIYTQIFTEIYEGQERFPIKDVGCYSWRPGEHAQGTAVDINWNENMEATINEDGSLTPTTGSHWKPGVDPFSIPEGGEVYRIFTKYGFSWGGNAWRSKRDYMHFSYFGT